MISTPAALSSSQNFVLPAIPELHDPNFLDVLLPPVSNVAKVSSVAGSAPVAAHPMMDALQTTAHHTLTENGAPAYSSTLSATLDVFQGLNHAFGTKLNDLLCKAWAEDSNLTLRIIWNLRSIHDGKSNKEAFYRAFGWLYENHPRTAISNLHLLVEPTCLNPKSKMPERSHGYWKDLLNILALETLDQLSHIDERAPFLHAPRMPFTFPDRGKKDVDGRDARIKAAKLANELAHAKAKKARVEAASEAYSRLEKKLSVPKYRALYIAVTRLFAGRLAQDLRICDEIAKLPAGADRIPFFKRISLAGKWAPTPHLSHDRQTNISTAIALVLQKTQILPFPSALTQEDVSARTRAAILRSFYQRWILRPLRQIILVPEPLMAANRWKEIKYSRVSSLSMKRNQGHFFQHDPEGFEQYLLSVEDGKKKISGATLMPHELIAQVVSLARTAKSDPERAKMARLQEFKRKAAETELRVVEAQWKTLIDNLRQAGSIDNAIAVCDVSGSMGTLSGRLKTLDKQHVDPIYPSVALSLVLARLARPPFANGFITFSARPQFVMLDPTKSLYDTVTMMEKSDWDMNTDLNAVFMDLILPLAIKHEVKQDDMIKRVFVFTDMQFDKGSGTAAEPAQWTTNHDAIKKAYEDAGYAVPEIVYWDLADHGTTPVTGEMEGVALMNGFSPAMLKVFMGEEEEGDGWEKVGKEGENVEEKFNPVNIMRKAVGRRSFDGLLVVD